MEFVYELITPTMARQIVRDEKFLVVKVLEEYIDDYKVDDYPNTNVFFSLFDFNTYLCKFELETNRLPKIYVNRRIHCIVNE